MSLRLVPLEHISWRKLEQDIVLLNMENSQYYSLNPCASRIWELVAEGKSVDAIADRVCGTYAVSRKDFLKDFESVKKTLLKEGLVREVKEKGAGRKSVSKAGARGRKRRYAKPAVKPHGQLSEIASAFKP